MEKEIKRVDPHATTNAFVARAIDVSRPNDDEWDPESPAILSHNFILFSLGKAISISSQLRMLFDWACLVQHPPLRFPGIRVNRKRADTDESSQALVSARCFQKIPRRDNRVHESIRKRFFASGRGQMKDDRGVLCRSPAILRRQKIASYHFNPFPVGTKAGEGFDPGQFTSRPYETAQVPESLVEQTLYKPAPDETAGPGYEDKVVLFNDKIFVFCRFHILCYSVTYCSFIAFIPNS